MSDLISREALKKAIENLIGYSLSYEAILNAIDNAPTVEAVPLEKTGLWTIITVTKNNHIYGTCSNCGYETYVNSYCGNCGSRNRIPKDFEQRYL